MRFSLKHDAAASKTTPGRSYVHLASYVRPNGCVRAMAIQNVEYLQKKEWTD